MAFASPPARSALPLRIGVIGAGMAAKPHLASLAELTAAGVAEVGWVVGRDMQRLGLVPAPAGAQLTTRLDDVLQDPDVAAVLVLTPPHTHLDIVRRAAQANKHVLVEKPLEVDLARAEALVDTCDAHGVTLSIMLQHRLRAGPVALRALLASGALGDLTGASATVRWWRPQSYYDVQPGRGTLARDGGGVLITQAIHTLDLLLGFIGLPERVTGAAHTSSAHQMECEDSASALLHYPGGIAATVRATTAAWPGHAERIEIDGTLGSATLESGALTVQLMDGNTMTAGADQGSGGGADPMGFDHAPHRAVLQDFFEAVRTGRAPAVTGRSALGVHRVIAAIVESAQTSEAIDLTRVKV
ncbi:MAG: Gfo/Idh/MocA family oxidoreductase [Burkholderiales bacterium]